MQQRARIAIITVVSLVMTVSMLPAQTFGRASFRLVTADGEPIPEVTITATSKDLNRFKIVKKTNKKGRAAISFADATKTYDFVFEHPDYPGVRRSLKPNIGDTIERDIILRKTASADSSTEIRTFSPAETSFNEGVDAMRNGDNALAVEKFRGALELDRGLTQAYLAMAQAHLDLENYQEAIAAANQMASLGTPSPSTYQILYQAHTALGNTTEATQARDALAGSGTPEETAALFYNEGVAALKVGDDNAAEASFMEALKLSPGSGSAVKGLALIYIRQEKWSEAAEQAERYLVNSPVDADMLRVRWEAYRGLGDAAKEKQALDALTATDPRPLAAEIFQRGQTLFDRGQMGEAVADFERVLELMPAHARAHYHLGLCQVNLGQVPEARGHLETFLELAPDDPEAGNAKEMLSFLE